MAPARRAFELAGRLGHPVYGCVYLAVTQERDATLITADRRFASAAERAAPGHLRLLGT